MSATTRSIPAWVEWAPWTDKKGRLHPTRAVVFALLFLPALWSAYRWASDQLGARPLTELIHASGYWAAWMLLVSLMVTPAKAVLAVPNFAVVRRMVGNAALAYAAIHLVLYTADQKWRLWHVVTEIALRFYLTIGFVAFAGLCALGWTSTDGWVRHLGKTWKQLHRIVYGLAALGVAHFMLQSKADVSLPLLAAGVFFWLMLWRLLPAGRDRGLAALLGLAIAAAAMTLATEYLWYRFGTHIDPIRVIGSELDLTFGLHPAAQVLVLGLLFTAAAKLWGWAQGPLRESPVFTIVLFSMGAWVDDAATIIFGLTNDDALDGPEWILLDLAWMAILALLGFARWLLRGTRQARWLDALAVGCICFQVVLAATGNKTVEVAFASALAICWAALLWQAFQVSRAMAALLVPLGGILAYGVAGLF